MGIGAGFYVYMRPHWNMNMNPLVHHNEESVRISTTWEDFLKDCGGEQVIENFVHTKMVFNDKYENNVVNWSGYFADVKKKDKSLLGLSDEHFLTIFVKMEPSESSIFADLVLSISTKMYEKNRDFYDLLKKGEGISFEATMVGLGNEFKMHHLHGKRVTKNSSFKELDDILVRESSLP